MLAQAQMGEKLIFTKVYLGDGGLEDQNIEDLTNLI